VEEVGSDGNHQDHEEHKETTFKGNSFSTRLIDKKSKKQYNYLEILLKLMLRIDTF